MSSTTATPAVQRRGGGGARRGGRFGGGKSTGGNAANAAAAQPDDTEAVRNLRAKYADKLALLKELFSDWTDEDLLFALQDAGGEVELAVGRISEGHAEQFNSVKSKKQVKKENISTATPSNFHGTTGSTNGTATIISSARGGRGGASAARGGRGGSAVRGGRGGSRGGATRGGQSGIAPSTEEAKIGESSSTANASAVNAPTFADTVAATKQNGGASTAWGDDTEGLDLQTQKPTTAAPKEQKSTTEAAPAPAVSSSTAAVEETSEDAKGSNPISNAIQKVSAKLVPKGSKLSWAQVARPVEPAKEQPQPPKEAPSAPAAQRAQQTSIPPTGSTNTIETTSKALEKSDISHPIAAAPIAPSQEEPALNSSTASEAPIVPASAITETDPVSSTGPSAVGRETAPTSSRPAANRSVQSQRALQRAKQDAPVVMPGGNAQFDSLGKRFGGLSFLGGDEAETGAQTQGVATGVEEAAAPATTVTQASAPTHQDAFAQATSPQQQQQVPGKEPFNAQQYAYQQGLQQHQQAHQAAVAQAQNQHQSIANLGQQQNSQVQQQQDSQVNQYQQNSTGYGIQGQQPSQQQAQTQLPQAGQQGAQQSYGDYSSMYGGLDAQRLAGYYGNYDTNAASRGNDDRSALSTTQQIGQQQPVSSAQNESSSVGGAPHVAPPQQQQQQQAQQQFPNMMPYYYPHYYLPNQFQHFGQPAAGYGQYALYGGQPQHPSKPATPASLQSPYAQSLPHNDVSSSNPYGTSSNVGQYNQSPANTSALASTGYGDYGRGAPNSATTDYSKLYGSNNATNNNMNNNPASSIPGLSGFLGQQPSNGAGTQAKTQANTNSAPNSNSLDNAYRQYDNSKIGGPSPARQSSTVGLGGNQTPQVQSGLQNQQSQAQPHQQQSQGQQSQQQQQQQQQQHYYQQYNAYAGHQQPNNASANYASYPYRQYWGQ